MTPVSAPSGARCGKGGARGAAVAPARTSACVFSGSSIDERRLTICFGLSTALCAGWSALTVGCAASYVAAATAALVTKTPTRNERSLPSVRGLRSALSELWRAAGSRTKTIASGFWTVVGMSNALEACAGFFGKARGCANVRCSVGAKGRGKRK